MKFKTLEIQNIRSYTNQVINFPEGSVLLAGDIGSGKTTILLAVEYALFGLQPGQKGNSLLRNGANSGGVKLELEAAGKSVIIERRLKRTLRGVSNEYASITIDGEKEESSITEIKSKIVELLGYPDEFIKKNNVLYKYTVYTAQEQMKQIILEDPDSRINILRHVFGIEKYKQIKNNLALVITDLKAQARQLQGEISTLQKDKEMLALRREGIKALEERIIQLRREREDKSAMRKIHEIALQELESKRGEKRAFEAEIEKTKILITTKNELLANLLHEERELQALIQGAGEPADHQIIVKLNETLKEKRNMFEALTNKNVQLLAQTSRLTQEQESILAKKERIFQIDICPTCLQDVSEHHKHNIVNDTEKKITEIKRNIVLITEQRREVEAAIKEQKDYIRALEAQKMQFEIQKARAEHIGRAEKKIREIAQHKQAIEQDQKILIRHIDGLKERILQYSPLEIQCKKKEAELREAMNEERRVEIRLAELEKEYELSLREITFAESTIAYKEKAKRKLYEYQECIDWLNNQFLKLVDLIESNVLFKLRKEFSTVFRKWFLMLVPENSLDSQIDENFTPVILQKEAEMDYTYLSGGERTAVALAYRLALNQTINSLRSKIRTRGIVILDEPTDGFSDTQITKIRDILEELNAEQLIIVSHEQKIEGFVENILRVTKEGMISRIEDVKQETPVVSLEQN